MQVGMLDKSNVSCNSLKTKVMGIVNVTPDSFSDGGKYFNAQSAIKHAYQLIEEGVDILDIGAESTKPGASYVSAQEEWNRLRPVLDELCRNSPVPISIDTYKSETAARSLESGVHMINDIWGGLWDPEILKVVADAGCIYIWTHNRKEPVIMDPYKYLLEETHSGIEKCLEAGIKKENLMTDPGIGFGKTYEHNLLILNRLKDYCQIGYPVLLGTSRKSVIGNTLNVHSHERKEGSLATAALGVWQGVEVLRVHDVQATVRCCRMIEAIKYQ